MTEQLRVEYRKIETLIPFARNPRTHSEAQIAKLANPVRLPECEAERAKEAATRS